MSELGIDMLAQLRAEATAREERKQNAVKGDDVAKIVFGFLNDTNSLGFLEVESVFARTDLTNSAIVQRFTQQITKYKLNELVQCVNSGGHVWLVKMTDPPENEDDADNAEDELGVESIAD